MYLWYAVYYFVAILIYHESHTIIGTLERLAHSDYVFSMTPMVTTTQDVENLMIRLVSILAEICYSCEISGQFVTFTALSLAILLR